MWIFNRQDRAIWLDITDETNEGTWETNGGSLQWENFYEDSSGEFKIKKKTFSASHYYCDILIKTDVYQTNVAEDKLFKG